MSMENHTITMPYKEYLSLKTKIRQAEKEADVACQALHEYRDVCATKCDDDWHDARGPLPDGKHYTGRRAEEALKKMPDATKRRGVFYERSKAR